MLQPVGRDRVDVDFTGAEARIEPLTWGQKAIWQDMQDSGNQFSMQGMMDLPGGSSIEDVAARVSALLGRHAALRMRLRTDETGRPCQEIAGSGQFGLDILTFPDEADPDEVAQYRDHLFDTWHLERFDFTRDWPLRTAARTCCYWMTCWPMKRPAAARGPRGTRMFSTLPGPSRRHSTGS